ncbi:MAG: RING-HC finger protein [Paraclostridium dentum]|uniref:RING-HC finger protein n=1 Tax=Paraclostridium dentum TaxID=2662455 RepID=UPI003EE6D191
MNTKVLKNVFKSKEAVHHAKQVIKDTLLEVQKIATEVQVSVQNVQSSAREVRRLNRNVQKTVPKEQQKPKVQKTKPEYLHCSVCLTAKVNKVLTSCGHTFCKNCIPHLNSRCAICRTSFSNYNIITIYL